MVLNLRNQISTFVILFSMTKIFRLKPWSPHITKIADKLMSDIHAKIPDAGLLFMGAAALGLPGKNDIDLDITAPVEKIPEYTETLKSILGEPKEQTLQTAVWNFYIDDIEIDAILSDPKISHVPEQQKMFETLKSSPALLEEYKLLKISCDGMPYTEYEMKKKEFFHKKILN